MNFEINLLMYLRKKIAGQALTSEGVYSSTFLCYEIPSHLPIYFSFFPNFSIMATADFPPGQT
jgi:hypothetical protein